MRIDPDLQPECPECGCEVLFEVMVDGVVVVNGDGPCVRFLVRDRGGAVARSAPLLEGDLDVDCPQCGFSGFLSDVLDDLGPANRPEGVSRSRRSPIDPDLQATCPSCDCEGMFHIDVTGVLIQTANGPVVRYPEYVGGQLDHRSTPLLVDHLEVDCPTCRHRAPFGEVYGSQDAEAMSNEDEGRDNE